MREDVGDCLEPLMPRGMGAFSPVGQRPKGENRPIPAPDDGAAGALRPGAGRS